MTSTLICILHAYWNAIHFKQLFSLENDAWCFVRSIDCTCTLHLSCPMLSDSAFGIVEPFPENIYPLEFTKADVTCVAFDANGVHVPEKIKFVRRDQFNRFEELKPNDNLRFTNINKQQGKYGLYASTCIVLRFV